MTLEEFAKKAGVTFVACDPEWGGTVGYKEKDYPNMTIAGFKTKEAALKSWVKSSFGETLSKVVLKLIKDSERKQCRAVAKGNAPVARICSGWQLLFIGSEPIAEVVRKHDLKIGDALYAIPPTASQIEQETAEACSTSGATILRNIQQDNSMSEGEKDHASNAVQAFASAIRSGAWKEFKK